MANINVNSNEVSLRSLRNSDSFHKQSDHRYVNQDDGNDGNDGSMYRPWKTVTHALVTAQNGHDINVSGQDVAGGAIAFSNKSGLRLTGEHGATTTVNLTLTNCFNVVFDFDFTGSLTLNNCNEVYIESGENITQINANNHDGFLYISGNVGCDINAAGAGIIATDIVINGNSGGAGSVLFTGGATGTVAVKNSVCASVENDGTAGAIVTRLENAYTLAGDITQTVGAMDTNNNTDPLIDEFDLDGRNDRKLPTTEAVVTYVLEKTASAPPEAILDLQTCGTNSFMMRTSRAVYTASGDNVQTQAYTGRGRSQGEPRNFGVDNLLELPYIGKEDGNSIDACCRYDSNFVLFDDGELWGYGRNSKGQLGLGDAVGRGIAELSKTGVAEIYNDATQTGYSFNDHTSFIRDTDGWIWAAGRNSNGVMGLGDTTQRNTWTRLDWIGQNPKFLKVIGSIYNWLVVQKPDDSMWMAGFNGGQFGIGNTINQPTGVDVSDDWFGVGNKFPIKSVVGGAGYFDTTAKSNSSMLVNFDALGIDILSAAGNNNWGQLGQGNLVASNVPLTVSLPNDIVQLSGVGGGPLTVSALLTNGDLYSWGHNADGQVGNGTLINVTTPTLVKNNVAAILRPSIATNIYSFDESQFIRDVDGYCWSVGYNLDSSIGVGDNISRSVFTRVLTNEKIKAIGQFHPNSDGRNAVTVFATDNNELFACGEGANFGVTNTTNNSISSPMRIRYK